MTVTLPSSASYQKADHNEVFPFLYLHTLCVYPSSFVFDSMIIKERVQV